MGFLDYRGEYYDGERQRPSDREVPTRPSPVYTWNGTTWVLDSVLDKQAQIDAIDKQLLETDQSAIRISEDIIDVLIAKNVIKKTDLPGSIVAKISARKALRDQRKVLTG